MNNKKNEEKNDEIISNERINDKVICICDSCFII